MNSELLRRITEAKNILHTINRRKANLKIKINWFCPILHRNCLLKHVIERRIEDTRKRGRRRKQLLDDIKEKRRYWKLKDGAVDFSGVPRNFVRGVQQIQLRTERTGIWGDGSPLVRGFAGSCNLVQEISFHIAKFS